MTTLNNKDICTQKMIPINLVMELSQTVTKKKDHLGR